MLNVNSLHTAKRLYHLDGIDGLLVEAFSLRESLGQPWLMQLSTLSEQSGLDLHAMQLQPVTLQTTLADGSRWW
jgi:type VI secretion system secreted protein VgrG